jgi:SAM-dependent methyltransferase
MRLPTEEVNENTQGYVPSHRWLERAYLWLCERLYDELAWSYDAVSWLVSAGQWRRWQSEVWDEVRGGDVLELGCGTGDLLTEGSALGMRMVGVDRSPAMLAVARQKLVSSPQRGALVQGDGRCLPVASDGFDTVIATFPAGYILQPETLNEIHRVLRHQGRLVVVGLWVEAHWGGLERVLPVFYGRPSAQKQQAIGQRMEDAGFDVRWVEKKSNCFTVAILVGTPRS